MTKLEKAKKKVALMKAKKKAASKRLIAAERNGSEKQIALAAKRVELWAGRLEAAQKDLNVAKKDVPSVKDRIKETPLKKLATIGTLAVVTVVAVIGGVIIIDKRRPNAQTDEPATDTV